MNRAILPVVLLVSAAWLSGCASSGPPAGIAESQERLEEGRDAVRRKQIREAIVLFSKAVKANPDLAEAWYERGKCHIQIRLDPDAEGGSRAREQQAIDDFSMAIRKNPAYADAYYNRA